MLPREAVAPGRNGESDSASARWSGCEELEQRSEGSSIQAAKLMRRHVYRLGRHRGLIFGGQAPLAHPEPAKQVAVELAKRANCWPT